jgi:hypothetical protein
VGLEQQVRLVLVAGDLKGVGELRLILARLQVPADAADPGQQKETAGHEAEPGHTGDDPVRPRRARGRLDVVRVPVAALVEEQAVKVGAQRLIGGRELGGERSRRMGRHARRAEEIAEGGPLPDEPLDSGSLSGRIARVEALEGGEPCVGGRKQARVQRAEET